MDAAFAERPILITAEGIAIQAPKAAEELALLQSNIQKTGGAVKETIKDTKQLLKHEAEIVNSVKGSTGIQREVVLPKVQTYEQARNKALEIIGKVDQRTGMPHVGNLRVGAGQIVGRKWHGQKVMLRLDYDPIKGSHINVTDFRMGKGANGVRVAITFEGNELTVKNLLRTCIHDTV